MRNSTAPAWQVLLLDFKVEWPLSLVVSRRQLLQYQVGRGAPRPGRARCAATDTKRLARPLASAAEMLGVCGPQSAADACRLAKDSEPS
jgi:hypothetical protein